MKMASRDSLQHVITRVNELLVAKYLKLTRTVRQSIVRLTREMAKSEMNSHTMISVLLRLIIGGEMGPDNIRLCEAVLNIAIEFEPWLRKNQECLQLVVFRFLRLIQDHHGHQASHTLAKKEIQFVSNQLRTNFQAIMTIGRDLVRLLLSVVHIPEFHDFWRDLIFNPAQLQAGANFGGLKDLMKMRTSKKFIVQGVTFDMDMKLRFMLTSVRFGQQETHQKWFQKTYLSSLTSVTLRADLIRFVCMCIIPTNEILQSDILPRWALCGWILQQIPNHQAQSTSRLALIYDWLLFNDTRNNIMEIEPCILLMHHSRHFLVSFLFNCSF